MKNSEQEGLSIGLAEAYVGIEDFEKALEVLRNCYQKTSGIAVKEKIEEVTTQKTDFGYLQIISRADIYFSNKEYDKAIIEYEKAKLIKSKEVIPYRRIAEAYIELEKYDLALEEVNNGLVLTESVELNTTLETVNEHILKQQYDTMVTEAAEYIYQEDYENGIAKYKEAINQMPEEDQAYSGLAQAYLGMEEYQNAVLLLQEALKIVQTNEIRALYKEASDYVEAMKERERILSELYKAMNNKDTKTVMELLDTEIFKEKIEADTPIYYSIKGEGEFVKGNGMIIYDGSSIYSGRISGGIKKGSGIFFMRTPQYGEQSYYYYEGEWNKDKPNGTGKVVEVTTAKDEEGKEYTLKTVTEGAYYYAAENGTMHKYFYTQGQEAKETVYSAKKGVPIPMNDESGQPLPVVEGEPYAIGLIIMNEEPTEEYYYADEHTYWGVKPFINNK
jgi:tetratricopeptide (TPR) repeat protein